jgi:hypothetical protein
LNWDFFPFRRRISKKAYLVEDHDRIRFRRIDSNTHGTEDENLEDKLEASAGSGVLDPCAKLPAMLQATLQGILQGAGPVDCYYKVLTGRVVEREFRARQPSAFLFLASSFLAFLPWAVQVLRALDGLGSCRLLRGLRLPRLLQIVAG